MTRKRIFVAIDLPPAMRGLLADLDPKIKGMRWTAADQLHLTLGFFAAVPSEEEERFRDRLRTVEFHSFFLPVIGLGTFPPRGAPNIVWIGVGSGHPHLFQIHKRVQEAALAAGLEPELRPWHPHITLARCRDVSPECAKKFLREHTDFDAGLIRVDAFHLYSSKLTPAGSIHSRELTIPCRGGL